jgi:hypothetical protein
MSMAVRFTMPTRLRLWDKLSLTQMWTDIDMDTPRMGWLALYDGLASQVGTVMCWLCNMVVVIVAREIYYTQ